jgi:hypothetical protein
MAIKFFNNLTIPGVITDSTLTLGDAFIKWDSLNTILIIDGTGAYDGVYIGDPDGDTIAFEGTDMSLSSSTGDAGAYAINNATGGSMALQLKAGTSVNSTLEVPEASGTIALLSDIPAGDDNGIYGGSGNLSSNTVVSMHDISSPGTDFNLRFENILSETVLSINPTINSVGIGTDTQLANLHLVGDTEDSVVFKVDGTFGELFTITDSLTGVLFSVNNISGLPVFEVEDTDEIRMGTYSAISGYTTARNEITTVGDTIIYTADVSNYTMVVFEYVLNDGTNLRAGNITAVTDGITVQSVETITTPSIGNTADITMSVTLDASPAELNLVATTSITTGWVVKTIVRTI